MATSSSKSGPSAASLNAPLPAQPGKGSYSAPDSGGRSAAGRDAGEGAGVGTGLYEKTGFHDTGVSVLGKPIPPMGTTPWDAPMREKFARGHEFKNG